MPSWSSTVSHAIPTDGQTDRKPGEAVDCGGRGDQRGHGQNEKMLREGGPLIRITFNSLARLCIPCYKLYLPAHASILVFPCVQKSITESLQI